MTHKYEFMSNHNHSEDSNFRLTDCIIRAEDIVNRAIELGYKGVSITEHETVSSHIRILQRYIEIKKVQERYIKYINDSNNEGIQKDKEIQKELHLLKNMSSDFKLGLGNEIYLINDIEDVKTNYESGITKFWHFILIAKNKKGYEQIKRISSESAWKNWYRQGKMERVPTVKQELEEIIGDEKGNIIATSSCLGGELPNHTLSYFRDGVPEAKRKIHDFITWGIDVFGKDNFFIEIQPTTEIPQDNLEDTHPQIIFNQNAVKLAKAYGLSYTVATDSHYLKKEHRMVHEAYLKADEDNNSNRELGDFYATTYMMEINELHDLLISHLSENEIEAAFNGTMKIHNMIDFYDLSQSVIVPKDKNIPEFKVGHIFHMWYNKCPYIEKFAVSEDEQERYYLYLCEQGFISKNQEFSETNVLRINKEMEEIWEISENLKQRLASYYVLVQGLINNIMWKISYVGIARGSITGFYTAYLMDIIQMNPLKYNLPHWRHLEKSRPELPDIDTDTEASKRPLIFANMKEYYGVDNVLNTLTFKTEGSKSTVQTACKGWGIDNDTAQAMSDMIPFERGANWTLSECFNGNEEKNRNPLTEFINEVAKYEGLKEIMLMIEGLVCGRSIHASSVYVFENGYLPQNSRMRAPNGTYITAYNMHDSDTCGGLKIDVLTIKALDKIHTAVDLLSKYGYIEDQGTIKATYNKYIHPDVLEYKNSKMWQMIADNNLIDAFQFDTAVGATAAKKVKPSSLPELAVANSLMRLMGEYGCEQPIDTYIRFKEDITLWYKEMREWGLTEEEIAVLEVYLLPVCGVADTQEVVMNLTMDEKISNFTIPEANKMRKAIAKKSVDVLESVQKLFYSKAKENGTSEKMVSYVWNVQIKRQLGYSFSMNHTFPYSGICVQEMNIAHKFDKIFWNTACLTINAGAEEDNENNKTTQYGKIAKAISEIQSKGQSIALPNINKAKFGFTPDINNQKIVFGLKGICGIGDDIAEAIINNQPYDSLNDFLIKMEKYKQAETENKFGDSAIITLIKAGCFDELTGMNREEIMKLYIRKISQPLSSLSIRDIDTIHSAGLLTDIQKAFEYRLYRFKKYVCDKKFFVKQTGKSPNTAYYRLEQQFAEPYFFENFETNMIENKDYEYDEDGFIIIKKGSIDREFDKLMSNFKKEVLENQDILNAVNKVRFENLWSDKVEGTISKWEMDSLSFYYHDHELAHVIKDDYMITDFGELPQVPEISEHYMYRGKEKPRFKLSRICGTVLDKDKNKHSITLLTTSGVVTVKFYKGQFGFYDKQISVPDETGKKSKIVLEKSWFTRGNKLLVTGYRREDQFVPKKYVDSAYRHTLQFIKEIDTDGNLVLQSERVGENEDE